MLIFCFHGFTQFHLNINKPLHAGRGSSSFKWMIFEYISWVCPLSQALYQDHFLFTNQTQPKIMLLKSNFPCRSQFSFQSIRSLITGTLVDEEKKSVPCDSSLHLDSVDIFRLPTNSPSTSMFFQLCSFQSSTIPQSSSS